MNNIEQKVNEILAANGLDFTIEKEALIGADSGRITPYFGLFNNKSNECINTVKVGYTISQNFDVLNMVLSGIQNFGDKLRVSKAGSINGGRRVYIQLEITGTGKVGDDTVKKYITIIDSNDGSTGLSVGIGDEVMHCENQFFKFYKAGEAKFRHTATIAEKITRIPSLVETAIGESLKQIEIYNKFTTIPITAALKHGMVEKVLGYSETSAPAILAKLNTKQTNIMNTLYGNIATETAIVGNNVWGLFNGLTRYTTHEQKVPKRDNGKDESLMAGTAYKKAIDGFNFLLKAA